MTTGGEGGMVTTNDRELWLKMWSFKDHCKSWETIYEREHPLAFAGCMKYLVRIGV
jgi:dTDP-4-amino-4,6-dideoxygalactose transaminase